MHPMSNFLRRSYMFTDLLSISAISDVIIRHVGLQSRKVIYVSSKTLVWFVWLGVCYNSMLQAPNGAAEASVCGCACSCAYVQVYTLDCEPGSNFKYCRKSKLVPLLRFHCLPILTIILSTRWLPFLQETMVIKLKNGSETIFPKTSTRVGAFLSMSAIHLGLS